MSLQTKVGSLLEALTNTVVGFGINFMANLLILPMFFKHTISLKDNFYMGCCFTLISVGRSYALRRWFNGPLHSFTTRIFTK